MFYGDTVLSKTLVKYLRAFDHPAKVRVFNNTTKKLFPSGVLVKDEFGNKLRVSSDQYIGWSILRTGSYESETIRLGRQILENGGVFVDVGANFGLFSCVLGSLPKVQTYSIEPFANEFVKLQKNIEMNPSINAQLFNVALNSSQKLLTMEDFNSTNSGTVRILLADAQPDSKRHTVSSVTLQSLLTHAQVDNISLMKIDVEGYEMPVLEGLDWESSLRPLNIITEFTDYSSRAVGKGRKTLWDFMTERGYEGFTVRGEPLSSVDDSVPEDNAWFKDTARAAE